MMSDYFLKSGPEGLHLYEWRNKGLRLTSLIPTRLAFKKSLEPSHGVLQLLKNFYRVLLLHLLNPLFSVFHGLQALSIFCFS